ncbi:hypothetical protein OL548_34380 (plasmid) [Lysinibacillus sp. MHQ-1]|nr:hypothetical protein OL548_34380 [Lysinibacillus sp. MHQ-1]
MNFASNLVVDKSKVEQFHLSSPTGSSKNEFLKGETYRYWAFNGLLAKPGVKLRGRTDDGSMFSYEVPK